VDDDPDIRELVSFYLREEGFEVAEANDGADALERMEKAPADLVVFDIMMPNVDGWELCRRLHADYPDIPLLMVTAKGETNQKVKGFELGTDDYLVKPFDPPELIVRVKALLKRYRIQASHKVQIGNIQLNKLSYEAYLAGERIKMPPKEFELLFKLASHQGQILTRNQLIEQLWGADYEGDDRTVDVHIKRIRERFPEQRSYCNIVAIRGLGYKLEVLE
jgi:DNA-binding response OmpR family regulator